MPDHGNDKGQIDGCIGAAEEGSGEACKAQKNDKAEKQREIQKGETLSEGSDEKLKNTPGEIGYDEDIGAYTDIDDHEYVYILDSEGPEDAYLYIYYTR